MQIKYLENDSMEITNESGTIALNMNEVCALSYSLRRKDVGEALVHCINDFEDWCFEQSKEDVIADEELLDEMIEDAIYDNVDFYGEEDWYFFFEKYLDVVYDNN